MLGLLQKIFGKSLEKQLKSYYEKIEQINVLEETISKLSDDELKAKTPYFKQQLADGKTMEDILSEAFAVVREVAKRTLKMRHFDVQLIGGIIQHEGNITEMKTGEGKTLVATLPLYLNALEGKGAHLVTVNDYLAKRDAEWMGPVYEFLGMSVGFIQANIDPDSRKKAYASDITYGTNNEFGFDYLRDNMAVDMSQICQRDLNFAIVDEVDSILIDEARTPLIISGQVNDTTDKYKKVLVVAKKLLKGKHGDLKKAEEANEADQYQDFTVEEKSKHVGMTEKGIEKVEKLLGIEYLYDIKNMDMAHMLVQCLKAVHLFKKDVDYVIKDGEVVIVDEFTGRLMDGRRYSEGLHQSIEAKEGVRIQNESQTLASITFQNFFRMYKKLAGMTGTAVTEEAEFIKIYGLGVYEIPTNEPVVRKDNPDIIYKSKQEKYKAVIEEIKKKNELGQPCLVGTIAIETSELLSAMLTSAGVKHNVLNAKQHEREAEIVKDAGLKGMVTIATNMAGRGTDIKLGDGVTDLGGLHIIGTERHESRRIDNQLRGRSGRQGDPGSSKFFISLEDDLMRLFGGQKIINVMQTLGIPDDTPIEHGLITKSIARAQNKVEQYHFGIRKQVLQYDDVMNRQRETIYKLRRKILEEKDLSGKIKEFQKSTIDRLTAFYINEQIKPEEWNIDEFVKAFEDIFPIKGVGDLLKTSKSTSEVKEKLQQGITAAYKAKEEKTGADIIRDIEKMVLLKEIDNKWIDHLHNLDILREGIGLRAYGQKDPLMEYKIEGFQMFEGMMADIEETVVSMLFKVEVVTDPAMLEAMTVGPNISNVNLNAPDLNDHGLNQPSPMAEQAERRSQKVEHQEPVHVDKVGRNEPCPCGSGKKYKKCCGANS